MLRIWRRLDHPGLEVMRITESATAISARSTIIDAGADPFSLTCDWELGGDWRTQSLNLSLRNKDGDTSLRIERAGEAAWRVDGQRDRRFDGCLEPDLSATPFCNLLGIRALGCESGALTALYIEAATLELTPSNQRYERLGPGEWRYIDEGVAAGFEAVLKLDSQGLVASYEGLFEMLAE